MTAQPASRQRWLVPVLVVVVSVTVGGGLLARELYRRPQASPSEPIVVATSTAPLSPAQEPGPDKVGVTPQAAMHPQDDAVRNVRIAPTTMERTARQGFDEMEGWGTSAPIAVAFDRSASTDPLRAERTPLPSPAQVLAGGTMRWAVRRQG